MTPSVMAVMNHNYHDSQAYMCQFGIFNADRHEVRMHKSQLKKKK